MEPLQDKKGNAAALGFEALCALTAIKRCEQFSEESNAMRLKTIYEVGDKHPGMNDLNFSRRLQSLANLGIGRFFLCSLN
jgi:hypothetical protein